MPDSLLLAGQFEVAPQGLGPCTQEYELETGYNLGSPVPVTSTIAGMMLDGDRQAGVRTGNRAVALPILINAPDRLTLARLTDQLMLAVDAVSFTLQWTPEGGLPIIWDCFRATSTIGWDEKLENQNRTVFQREVDISFSASPFGRSPVPQTVAAALTPQIIDAFGTAPTGAYLDTNVSTQPGGSSAKVKPWWGWDSTVLQPATGATFSRNVGPLNLNPYDTVTANVLHSPVDSAASLKFTLTLKATSTGGGALFVQNAEAFQVASSTALALAYPAANNAADLLVCAVGWDTTNSPTVTVTDSAGNTWTQAATQTNTNAKQATAVFYAPNCAGAANTVTAHFSTSSSWRYLSLLEYDGMLTATPVDVTHTGTGTGTTASSGAATTTANADLVLGFIHDDSQAAVPSPGSGYSQRSLSPDGTMLVEELIQPVAGSVTATATFPTSQSWTALMVAFKATAVTPTAGSVTMTAFDNFNVTDATWHPISFVLPDNAPVLSNITSYSMSVLVTPAAGQPKDFQAIWFDDLTAKSASQARISTANGTLLTIPGILGSARAPANLTVTIPTAGKGLLLHRPPVGQDPNLQILTALPPTLGVVATYPVVGSQFNGTYSAIVPITPAATGAQTTQLDLFEWIGPNLATQDVASGGEISGTTANVSPLASTASIVSPGLRGSASKFRFTNGASIISVADTFGGICGWAGALNHGLTPIQPGQQYTVSITLGAGTSGTGIQAGLMWFDSALGTVSTSAKTSTTLTGGTVQLTFTVTAPSTAWFAGVRVTNTGSVPANMNLDVDNIQVEQGTVATPWVFPAQIGQQTLVQNWTAGTTNPRYVVLGEATLPLAARDNAVFHMQAKITDANANTYTDLMLLDTNGELVYVQVTPVAFSTLFVDEPDPQFGIGNVLIDYGTQGKLSSASAASNAVISGGPIALQPGDNTLLAHSFSGAPGVAATVYPRWMAERSA